MIASAQAEPDEPNEAGDRVVELLLEVTAELTGLSLALRNYRDRRVRDSRSIIR